MSDPDNLLTFEEALKEVGDQGRYQKTIFGLFLIPVSFMIPWTALVPIFQVSLPDHWCFVPGKPENFSLEQWKALTVPWTIKENVYTLSQCTQYVNPLEEVPDPATEMISMKVVGCQNGWQFNTTLYDYTLATDREWVCDKRSYGPRWLSVGVAGNVVGTLLLSFLADKYGRKPMMLVITQLYAVSNILKLFVTDEYITLLLMFISSMTFPANLQVSMIIVMEQVGSNMRASIATLSFLLWTFGMCLLPMIAWLSRNWITLGIVTSAPFFPCILCFFMYESPGWLVSVGNPHQAARILRKIAKINKKIPPEDLEIRLQVPLNAEDSKLGFLELFSMPTLRLRAILLTSAYACNNLVYYVLLYNTSNMSGNEFLNFFFLSVSELPGNLIGWVCAQNIGRRLTGSGFFMLSALSISFAIFLPVSMGIATTVCLIISKALINISFLIAYLQLAELYPTSHRSSGTGFASMVSSVAGTTAPYIAYCSVIWSRLPYVILLALASLGFAVTIFLPETLGHRLPQNVLEAENHLTDHKFWSYKGKRPKCLQKQSETNEDEIMLNDRQPIKLSTDSPQLQHTNSLIK